MAEWGYESLQARIEIPISLREGYRTGTGRCMIVAAQYWLASEGVRALAGWLSRCPAAPQCPRCPDCHCPSCPACPGAPPPTAEAAVLWQLGLVAVVALVVGIACGRGSRAADPAVCPGRSEAEPEEDSLAVRVRDGLGQRRLHPR